MAGRPNRRLVRLTLRCCLVVAAATLPTTAAAGTTDGDIHRTLSLSLTPDTPGEVAVTAHYDIPDGVRVLETSLPPRATVTVTLTNPTDRPANGSVPVALDGDPLETIDVALGPHETSTHELGISLPPGTHTITAGDTTVTVEGPTTNRIGEDVPVPVPGFGPVAVVIALLLTAAIAARDQ